MTEREGVIKYRLEHRPAPPPAPALVRSLAAWRLILRALGLVGQHPERYDGLGFGNLSRRIDAGCDSTPAFVITGTQTGYLTETAPEHYCVVRRYDLGANHILAEGPVAPSSEALTHAAIYAAAADIRYVFHAHHPDIWRRASALGLPGTPVDVAYGTPAMAEAVGALLARHTTAPAGVFYMAGHEDGIVAWGETAEAAGCALGPVPSYHGAALLPKIRPGKARGEKFSVSKGTTSNAAWPDFGRNPKGRGHFPAILRCRSLM